MSKNHQDQSSLGDRLKQRLSTLKPGAQKVDGAQGLVSKQAVLDVDSTHDALAELAELDSARTLVLAFGSPGLYSESGPFELLKAAFPSSIVVGCSGAGEISHNRLYDDSLCVTATRFSHTNLEVATVDDVSAEQSLETGRQLAQRLNRPGLKAIFILSEGLDINGTELVRGVNEVTNEDVVVTGGLAGDGSRFERTWIYADHEVKSNAVAAVGFYGSAIHITHGSYGGWDSFGPVRKVTRSEGNVLFELDGKPALALYKSYLGDQAEDLPASGLRFPLELLGEDGDSRNVVRTLLAVDEDEQSLTFAGDIPQDGRVQLMKAHFDRLIDGAEIAADKAMPASMDTDSMAVAVSCVGRRLVLGDQTEEELEVVHNRLKKPTMTGFYSYGELSPTGLGSCDLHNQTMTVTVFNENASAQMDRITNVDHDKTQMFSASKDSFASSQFIYNLDEGAWSTAPNSTYDSEKTLVLAFGAPRSDDHQGVFDDLEAVFPNSHVIGCSGSGEIANTEVHDDAVCVAVARFQHTELKTALREVDSAADSFKAGQAIADELDADDLKAIFILSEGLQVNGTDLVRGVNAIVDPSVVVTGGLAGDNSDFESTWVYADSKIRQKSVVAVGFYGDHVRVSHGSQGGWDEFGPVRKVTRSEGNVLFELDGRPALALYKTYLGDQAEDLPASGLRFPLALLNAGGEGEEARDVVRTLLAVDEDKQSLTFAGDIPEGAQVQLMKAHFDRLIDGAENAAGFAHNDEVNDNALVIAVSCVGRRLVLGDRTEDELEMVRTRFPEPAAISGFYSYGELSPVAGGSCDLHNQTMTLTVFGEAAEVSAKIVKPTKVPTPKSTSKAPPKPSSPPAKEAPAEASPRSTLNGKPAAASSDDDSHSNTRRGVEPTEIREHIDASEPPAGWQRPVLPIRTHAPQGGALDVESTERNGVMVVRMSGKMDEKFAGAALGRSLKGIVLIDLVNVHRVTSFGVREWLTMVDDKKGVDAIYLTRCSEAITNQLATIRAFAGDCHIVSFFAPYRCEHCSTSFNAMLDVDYDREEIESGQPPQATCPRCRRDTSGLDEDPSTFFGFARDAQPVPDFVRKQMELLEDIGTSEPIEKSILPNATSIRVSVPIDESIRWRRLLEGVEGKVIIDFMGGGSATEVGARHFASAVRLHLSDAEFELYDCPSEVIDALFNLEVDVTIKSGWVDIPTYAGDMQAVLIDFAASKTPLAQGKAPVAESTTEMNTLNFEMVTDLLRFGAGLAPSGTADAEPTSKATDPSADESASIQAGAKATNSPTNPSAQTPTNSQPSPSGISPAQSAVLAALVTLLIGAAVWKFALQPAQSPDAEPAVAGVAQLDEPTGEPTGERDGPEAPGATDKATDEAIASNSAHQDDQQDDKTGDTADNKPAAKPADAPAPKLMPTWADRPIRVDADTMILVGDATETTSEKAIEAAREQAVWNLLGYLETSLRGHPLYDVVAASRRADQPAAVKTFLRQMGPSFGLDRTDQTVRPSDKGTRTVVKFELPMAQVERAKAFYQRSFEVPRATFGVRFPTLVGSQDNDVIVLSTTVDEMAAGDVVLSEEDRSIYTLAQLEKIASSESWLQLIVHGGSGAQKLTIRGSK